MLCPERWAGNVAGVAVPSRRVGRGHLWMWVRVTGMATKLYTCSLACVRKRRECSGAGRTDISSAKDWGEVTTGYLFAACGMFGCRFSLQSNR